MTERDKIIEIIKRNGTYNGRSLSFDYYVIQPDDLADALFAAGIGDMTNLMVENEVLQRDVDNLTRTLEEGTEEFQEVQHRADVAERALDKACADIEQLMDCCRWAADGGVITIKEYTPEKATPQAYIDRTKKEIAEEKKDE